MIYYLKGQGTIKMEKSAVILDNGSGMVKAGVADNDRPSAIFPSITGKLRRTCRSLLDKDISSYYVGDEAQKMRALLDLEYPIEHGVVKNWDGMAEIWEYAFKKLDVDPENHPVLLTVSPRNPRQNTEKMFQIMFEKFCTPAAYVAIQAVLALYATGGEHYSRTTGIIIDSGDGVTHTVPIYKGHVLFDGIDQVDLAGRDLTHYLSKIFTEKGYNVNKEIVREIKEKYCRVLINYEHEIASQAEVQCYKLRNGKTIKIGKERFRCPEALFDPSMLNMDLPGIHTLVYNSIDKCDNEVQNDLFENIILSGGTTMLPGLCQRMQREIEVLASDMNVRVTAEEDRKFSVWKGGKKFACLDSFKDKVISKKEYDDAGSKILQEKCSWISISEDE